MFGARGQVGTGGPTNLETNTGQAAQAAAPRTRTMAALPRTSRPLGRRGYRSCAQRAQRSSRPAVLEARARRGQTWGPASRSCESILSSLPCLGRRLAARGPRPAALSCRAPAAVVALRAAPRQSRQPQAPPPGQGPERDRAQRETRAPAAPNGRSWASCAYAPQKPPDARPRRCCTVELRSSATGGAEAPCMASPEISPIRPGAHLLRCLIGHQRCQRPSRRPSDRRQRQRHFQRPRRGLPSGQSRTAGAAAPGVSVPRDCKSTLHGKPQN